MRTEKGTIVRVTSYAYHCLIPFNKLTGPLFRQQAHFVLEKQAVETE